MRQKRWLEFQKDYNFGLNYHPCKANIVDDALSRKSLHMSGLMIRELDLIEKFRDLNMICELTPGSVTLGILKVNNEFLNKIRENQKLDVKLIDLLSSVNPNEESDFKVDEHEVLRFRGSQENVLVARNEARCGTVCVCMFDLPEVKGRALETFKVIVKLHGAPPSIVFDRDPQFTSKVWGSLQEALGTKMRLSFANHPQTDSQTERTIQSIEDLLRACVIEQGGIWDSHLQLIEFTNNNNFHSSIGMAPFEALYGRRCRTPMCWYESGESVVLELEIV
ncbi:uncharacterized protein LOC127080660 [Lathyrus oleraceus]|uniref:uncharacterized protein LOC127080660 n=1 Tax=Pisum sativum TaxID=3888 RepID=UPI0021D149AC|nr:uncharacterized protein LOC127080660 [Pisum sativum]